MSTERTLSTLPPRILTASSRLRLWQSVQAPLPHPSPVMAGAGFAAASDRAAAARKARIARCIVPPEQELVFELYNDPRSVPSGNFDVAGGNPIQQRNTAISCRQ